MTTGGCFVISPAVTFDLAIRTGRELCVRPVLSRATSLYAVGMWNAVRSLWAEPPAAHVPARNRRDVVFAAVLFAVVVAEVILRKDLTWPPAALAVGSVLTFALLVRRTHPLVAVTGSFGSFALLEVATSVTDAKPVVLYSGFVVLVLVYALFRWGSGRHATLGIGCIALCFAVIVTLNFTGIADVVGGAALLLLVAATGLAVRYRTTARTQLIDQAKLQEREQLARELHDTVAHHVTAIAIQAQAGLFLAKSSSLSGAQEALEIIDREAAQTLSEMRTMVGALRDQQPHPDLRPQRGVADIAELGGQAAGSLRVDVSIDDELTRLAPALQAALYRVAQESVTNARRHAQQATLVRVRLTGTPTEVHMTVEDDGLITTSPSPGGFGLIGMTERVTLLGGSFAAGPTTGRGWRVAVTLPRKDAVT
jgi:signal transduction histidine kinase